VHALFTVVSDSVPRHLRILAQLASVLRDGELRGLLRAAAPAAAIQQRIAALEARRAEAALPAAQGRT
jgi:hypothetical protein